MRQRFSVALIALDDALERQDRLIDLIVIFIDTARFEERGHERVMRLAQDLGETPERAGLITGGDFNAAELEDRLVILLVDPFGGFERRASIFELPAVEHQPPSAHEPAEG